MATYNVFVPAKKGSEMPDMTIKVEASNWLVELKESLRQIGDGHEGLSNIVCETAPDGSLRVADPGSKRVFLIKQAEAKDDDLMAAEADRRAAESRAAAEAAAQAKAETESRLLQFENQIKSAPAPAPEPVSEPTPEPVVVEAPAPEPIAVVEPVIDTAQEEAVMRLQEERQQLEAELAAAKAKLEAAALNAANEATGVLGNVEVERHERKPKADKKASKKAADEWDDLDDWYDGVDEEEQTVDDVVSEMFMATEDLHEKDPKEAASFVLGLINKYVEAQAASVFMSDVNSALNDLIITAASGPIGDKIVGIHVPLGKGIVGFSVVNGVKLIVNSANNNPNFYGKLDEEFGFQTKSILCVPIQFEDRTYGAIELINKPNDESWTTYDSNVLESVGRLMGRAVETRIALTK